MTEFDLGKVTGDDGRGIQSVELVSTVGKEKTYRITYTDEDYYEFTVKDGEDALNDIVTSWEQTLSDSKVPSEKLTKNTLDTKVDKVTGKGLSTEDYTTSEKTKLAGIEAEANKTVVDSSLSDSSTNPVQNNVVKSALDDKVDSSDLATVATTGDYDDLTDKPSIPSKTSDLTNDGDGTNPFLTQHQSLSGYLKTTDIVDDLTTADPDKPLSARQGKILKDLIDSLLPTVANVVLTSDKSVLSAYDSESATLTATVTNSQSAPVASETVTFYKGSTVLGTATTNSSGVATLTYTATGAGDLTLTAKAEDIISNNLQITDCIIYDELTVDKNRYTLTSGTGTLTYNSEGATALGTTFTDTFWYSPENYLPSTDYTCEIDITDWGSNGCSDLGIEYMFIGINPNTSSVEVYVNRGSGYSRDYYGTITFVKGNTFKFEVTGTTSKSVKVYYDGTLLTTINNVPTSSKQFFKTYNNRSTTFKNLKIY